MNDKQSARVDADLVRAIFEHLASHPHAADSALGVARWWLGAHAVALALPDVELALKQLVDSHDLRQESLADGTTLYSKDWTHPQPHPQEP
ncbi:MAG: hypothetical protein ABIR56_08735 [Polaromonas sp.]